MARLTRTEINPNNAFENGEGGAGVDLWPGSILVDLYATSILVDSWGGALSKGSNRVQMFRFESKRRGHTIITRWEVSV